VHVASGLRTGGAEMSLLRLLQNLDREAFPPLVVSLRAGGTVAEKIRAIGIELIEIEGSTASDSLRNWRGAAARVMRFKPAIIHGWMYDGNLAATWMHRRMRKQSKLAWNVRSSIDRLADHALRLQCSIRLNALCSRRPDVVVFNSHVAVDQHARLGFKAKKVAVISNGLDLANYPSPQPEGRERMRQQLGVPLEVPVICLVARFHPMKDHANFLEAAASLKDTNAMFLLIGPGVVATQPGLSSLITRFDLDGRVLCLGERHDVADLLAAADMLCLSSAWGEGCPNAVAEGMACGLPCVVTDVGDSALLVGDGGVVVPPRDAGALSQALRQVLTLPRKARAEMGQRGRMRIANRFSADRTMSEYAALYRASGFRDVR